MKKLSVSLAVFLTVLGVATVASADESDGQKGRGVITLPTTRIYLRPQRPQAAIEITALSHQTTLAELDLPLLGRIEAVIASDPF
jgi:hypothetical protein